MFGSDETDDDERNPWTLIPEAVRSGRPLHHRRYPRELGLRLGHALGWAREAGTCAACRARTSEILRFSSTRAVAA